MDRNDQISALVAVVVTTMVGLVWVKATSGEVAAWVQAIGTIVAITAAGHIAGRQMRHANELAEKRRVEREKERSARASVLAYRLAALLFDMEISIQQAEKLSQNLSDIAKTLRADGSGVDAAAALLKIQGVWDDAIYTELQYLPLALGQTVAFLLYSVTQYNRALNGVLAVIAVDRTRISVAEANLRNRLASLRGDLHKANADLGPLL